MRSNAENILQLKEIGRNALFDSERWAMDTARMKSRRCWPEKQNTDRTTDALPKEQPFGLLVDIQQKLAEGKSDGYACWAKRHNLKEISKTLIFLQEHKISSVEEVRSRADEAGARYHELGDSIKAAEKANG